jgi:beta-lactamase superfamily II metal-dependent hydrolase
MKLTIFRSDKGDCLLASDSKKHHILIDGGMRSSYQEHVAPFLGRLRKKKEKLDLVYVSHIDQDHISGVLNMMDDLVAWLVHEYQIKKGNTTHKKPSAPYPPKPRAIWHNSFHEQIGKNAGEIADMLAASATLLNGDTRPSVLALAESCQNLATSKKEAIQLSRRIGKRQLKIPLNPEYDGKLMWVSDPVTSVKIGSLKLTIIGPFDEDLRKLRTKWNAWLKKNKRTLEGIKRKAKADEDLLGMSEIERLFHPLLAQAKELGDRKEVTPANLASLMVLLEEKNKTVLLTGDGHWQDILAGLDAAGKLDQNGGMHVNVLKVQHHGSEHNTHPDFCKAITADRYIFCGNGAHHNPDLNVVKAFINSRIGKASQRSTNAKVSNRFELFFNSDPSVESGKEKAHMKKLKALVKKRAKASKKKLRYRFLTSSYKAFTV